MNTPIKRTELDGVLQLLSKGFTKAEVRKKLNLKPSALAYHLRRLEDLGVIERQGKYIINVLSSSVKHPKVTKNQVQLKLNKRGHAYNFKIIFPTEKNLLKKPKVRSEFKAKKLEKLQFGSYKLIKDKNSIWINKGSLTIYSNNSYYSKNALYSKFRALKDIDNLIVYLKDRFGFSGMYGIEIFREHYGLIFNKFAQWLLKRGGKLYVKEKGNKTILWVDNSRKDDIGLTEFEGDDPLRINQADKYFQSHEDTSWQVTPEFCLKSFNEAGELIKKNAQNLDHYAKHLQSHIKSVEQLGANVGTQNKIQENTLAVLQKMDKRLERLEG